ncbi:MAG TPA: FUSC family protein [Thermoleophilaceae bacterium]
MNWLREHDPGFAALRRAGRTAIVMPAMFAIGDKVIANVNTATFSAFGSFAMLLLVDFAGPMRARLRAQFALALTGAAFVCLGTLASRSTALATIAMGVVAFGVIFAGVVSSTLAGATTALLLAFILPVSLPGTASSIPDRLLGWGLAAGAALLAIAFLWPAPVRNPLRAEAIAACRAYAARLRAEVAFARGPSKETEAGYGARATESDAALQSLRHVFFATPYRPTGLSTAARSTVRLVDELGWLDTIVAGSARRGDEEPLGLQVCQVKSAAALLLERCGDLLEIPTQSPQALHEALAELKARLSELEESTTRGLPGSAGDVISSLDPSFRAQELSFVVSQVARNVDFAAAAERRGWLDQVLGRQPAGLPGPLIAVQERAGAHVRLNSLWLQNSVRGAVALALAVLVAQLTGVQHSFWVVLGTLSVLRSNALSTGQNVLSAIAGTAAGFVIGAAIVAVIGTNATVLWFLLPPVILLAGLAPAAVSFAAGQAGFTLTLLILFNILAPEGYKVGLVRIEDVALGCAVSLAVGVLFWPRGASTALGRALGDAYTACANYLARAVEFGMGRCDSGTPGAPAPTAEGLEAAAASRRLDDTFRTYLAERGAKPVPMAEVTSLLTGVAGLRLAGDAVLDLWQGAGQGDGDRAKAKKELTANAQFVTAWYASLAASLTGSAAVPETQMHDTAADSRLVEAVSRDLLGDDGQATGTAVRMIWTGDHLDAARRLEGTLAGPAKALVETRS